jgi:hypothetical protein
MWNMKGMIIRVKTEATGTVTKGLKKSMEAMPQEKIQLTRYNLEHHTQHCSLKRWGLPFVLEHK